MSSSSNLALNKILKIANDLLISCSGQQNQSLLKTNTLKSIDDLKSGFFIHLFENICNVELENKRIPAKSIDDEIHNVQTLIDTLAAEILHEDLSHLSGELICNGDLASIEYLLDILKCICEWISSRLESMNTKSITSNQSGEKEQIQIDTDSNYADVDDDDVSGFDSDIWEQHLEQLNEFEQLHQELEMNYLSSSNISSVNTSAFSYKPSKKIVTFNSKQQKTHPKPNSQIGKKLTDLYLEENKENKPKQNFVKLNNCPPPPTNLMAKSSLIRTNDRKVVKPKANLNPVQRFQEYKKLWEKQKAPGEKDHAELRWWVRSKMSQKPIINQIPLAEITRQEWID